MRKLILLPMLALVACGAKPALTITRPIQVNHQAIIGGSPVAQGSYPAVVELSYFTSDGVATCTGELIGAHTVMTAGHCTDLTAGGELSGSGGGPLTVCPTVADANDFIQNGTTSACNIAVFAIFNTCTTSDANGSCEENMLNAGSFILVDKLVNPGYNGNVQGPYSASRNDNDIGLAHLSATTLASGAAEPALLTFNRSSLGSACTDLGSTTFVGFGLTVHPDSQGNPPNNALTGLKYSVSHDVKVKDTWHNEEDGPSADQWGATCGNGSGAEPTCSGDSGGPSFNSSGEIIAVTSLGDATCTNYGEDVRVDAYASWIDSTMTASSWGDVANGGGTSTTTTSTSAGTTGTTASTTTSTTGTTGSGQDCQTCGNTAVNSGGQCASQWTACANDTTCSALVTCLGACTAGDSTCVQNCANTDSGGITLYNAINSCVCDSACSSQCASECGSSSTSSTNGGTGTTATTGGNGQECAACTSNADCTNGGICLGESASAAFCSGAVCSQSSPCANSSDSCFQITDSSNNPLGDYCYPSTQTCVGATTSTTGGNTTSTNTTGTNASASNTTGTNSSNTTGTNASASNTTGTNSSNTTGTNASASNTTGTNASASNTTGTNASASNTTGTNASTTAGNATGGTNTGTTTGSGSGTGTGSTATSRGTLPSTSTTGSSTGGSSGGCGSTGAGEFGFALMAVLPLLRRRRS